jgi:predicted nuclease of predicted toxin-antitoxin system
MDVHVPGPVTRALLLKGIDVLTAQADESAEKHDPELLERATELRRVLVTQDREFLAIGVDWQRRGKPFGGIIFGDQMTLTIGKLVEDLTIAATAGSKEDFANRIQYLPI